MPPVQIGDQGDSLSYIDDQGNVFSVPKSQVDASSLGPTSSAPAASMASPSPTSPTAANATDQSTPVPSSTPNPIVDLPAYDPKTAAYQALSNPSMPDSLKEDLAKKNGLDLSADEINKAIPQTAAHTLPEGAVHPTQPPISTTNPNVNPNANQNPSPTDTSTKGIFGLASRSPEDAAIREGAKNAMAKANELSAFQEQLVENDKAYQAQQKARFDQQGAYVQNEIQKYKDLSEKYQGTTIQNPWANASTGTKVMAAISVGLGALGAAYDGTHINQAMKMIDDSITRDIELQKLNADKQRSGVEMQGNLVNQVRSTFSDENQREAVMHSIALDRVKDQIAAIASKYDSDDIQSKANLMIAQADQKQKQLSQQFTSGALDNLAKYRNLMNPTATSEQANAIGDSVKLQSLAKQAAQLGTPSRIGGFFNSENSRKVQQLNSDAYEALFHKPASGKEFDDWVTNGGGIGPKDTASTIADRANNWQREAAIRRMGAGRAGQTTPGAQ